jgi:MotA/TolQ/ExbB proton channel family
MADIALGMEASRQEFPALPAAPQQPAHAPAEEGAAPAFLSRCIVLQAIGGAGIVGLWTAGIAGKPFEGDNAFLCWLIVGMGLLGIACVFRRRWNDVQWLATHVVRIGLLGTVIGLIIAFAAAGKGGSADPDEIRPMIAAVVEGMYVSLYATLLGIATNLWLKINLRLLGRIHG